MREVEERRRSDRGLRAKIVEMGGQTLKEQIYKSNPWSGNPCGHSTVFCMQREGEGGDCKRKNVGRKITCSEFKSTNHGETSCNMFGGGKEHLRALT